MFLSQILTLFFFITFVKKIINIFSTISSFKIKLVDN